MKNCYTGSKEIADFDKKKQELAKKCFNQVSCEVQKSDYFPKKIEKSQTLFIQYFCGRSEA